MRLIAMKTLKKTSVVRGYHGLIVGVLIPIFTLGDFSRAYGNQSNQETENYFHPFRNEEVLPLFFPNRVNEVEWQPSAVTPQVLPIIWAACIVGSIAVGVVGKIIIDFHTACQKVDSKALPVPGKEKEDDGTGTDANGKRVAASGPLGYGTCACHDTNKVGLASIDDGVDVGIEPVIVNSMTLRVFTSLDDSGTLSTTYQVEQGQPPVPIAEANAALESWGLPPEVINRNPIHTINGVEVPASESPIFLGNGKIILQGPDYDGLQMAEVVVKLANVLDGSLWPFVKVVAPVGRELEMHFERGDAGFFQVTGELVY